jgi:uncharacterized protein YgbK (DUF1537 family)
MTRVVIIADDLSGAADCASAFVDVGLEALIVIDRDAQLDGWAEAAQVISIDADTRRLAGTHAARIHLDLWKRHAAPERLLYKKIDSTLRGNFAAELKAIADLAGLAIVAPAFPQAGRLTREGHQFLRDTPLEMTEIWRGEGIAGSSYIPGMLENQGISTAAISLVELREGGQRLQGRLEALASSGAQAIVCDAETDDDLKTVMQASMPLTCPRFWVGSAGLARHLPAAAKMAAAARELAPMEIKGSILTVVGSLSSVSRMQADQLFISSRQQRIEIRASVLREGQSHPEWQDLRNALTLSLQQHRDVLMVIGTQEAVDMNEGLRLCQSLALLIAPLGEHIGAVISTGGETARAVLTAMGSKGLRLVGEIESGVPMSVAVGMKPIRVITKAGAFGSRETLWRCYETLRRARDESARDPIDMSTR